MERLDVRLPAEPFSLLYNLSATIQAQVESNSDREERLGVTLQWPGGQVHLTEGGEDDDSSHKDGPIDVEWREIQ